MNASVPKIPLSVRGVIHAPNQDVLLIERAKQPGFWQSVTGSKDTLDEDWALTALREVAEETGLAARIVAPLGSVAYVYADARGEVDKTVHFFLMELASAEVGPIDGELERVAWVALDDAERRLSFETERRVVARARQELAKP